MRLSATRNPWAFVTLLCGLMASSGGSSVVEAADDAALSAVLRTFRDEFVAVTPGQGNFPAEITLGRDDAGPEERPAHRVRLRHPFSIARYEVPQNLWEAVLGNNPSRWTGPRNSVECVSWEDCRQFCRRATELMRRAKLIAPDEEIRLPTEAEWEYCARAGTTTKYSFGDDASQLGEFGWFTGNAAGNDPAVGAKRPNPWQLYDIHGYLWEWCADNWHSTYDGAPTDGTAWVREGDSKQAVLRGGSWKDAADRLTSSARQPAIKELRDDAVGLRCVLAKVPVVAEQK